jgi:hypothetical protein
LAAGYHHQPEAAAAQEMRQLVSIIYVADTLCCHSKLGCNLTAGHQSLDDTQLAKLQIDPKLVALTNDRLDQLVGEASAALG